MTNPGNAGISELRSLNVSCLTCVSCVVRDRVTVHYYVRDGVRVKLTEWPVNDRLIESCSNWSIPPMLIIEFTAFKFSYKYAGISTQKFRNFGNDKTPKFPESRNCNHLRSWRRRKPPLDRCIRPRWWWWRWWWLQQLTRWATPCRGIWQASDRASL